MCYVREETSIQPDRRQSLQVIGSQGLYVELQHMRNELILFSILLPPPENFVYFLLESRQFDS
jgi:hypothetical protein